MWISIFYFSLRTFLISEFMWYCFWRMLSSRYFILSTEAWQISITLAVTLPMSLMIDGSEDATKLYFSIISAYSALIWELASRAESRNILCLLMCSWRNAIESNYFCWVIRFLLYWTMAKCWSSLDFTFFMRVLRSLCKFRYSKSGFPKNINSIYLLSSASSSISKNSYQFLLLTRPLSADLPFFAPNPCSNFLIIFLKFLWFICFDLCITHLKERLTQLTIIFKTSSLQLLKTNHFSKFFYFFCLQQVYLLQILHLLSVTLKQNTLLINCLNFWFQPLIFINTAVVWMLMISWIFFSPMRDREKLLSGDNFALVVLTGFFGWKHVGYPLFDLLLWFLREGW